MDDLTELHACELEIMTYFRDLCKRHGLRCFITAGTLLGAVRHKGFIPWDDDVDFAMPREDFDKLGALMKKEHGDFFYQDGSTDKNYPFYFAKLRSDKFSVREENLGDVNDGVYVDIFPLDPCPADEDKASRFFKKHLFFTTALISKFNADYKAGYTKPIVRFALGIAKRLPADLLRKMQLNNIKRTKGKRLCTVGGAHGYPAESYDAEWFSAAVEMEFEGEKFSAPCGYDSQLKNMYGDYMTPPPESERGGHFTKIERN